MGSDCGPVNYDDRGVSVSAILAISDILSEEDWNQGYHSAEKLEGLKQIFEVALEAMAINSSNKQEKENK